MPSPSLKPEDIDKVGHAVLTLAQEMWTMMERQRLIEHALREKGIDISELIEQEPSGHLADQLSAERKSFIENIVSSLK